jgi:hypothetical protein
VLPSTVKEVLSVRHVEDDLQLRFVDRNISFDKYVPRQEMAFSSVPGVVFVGSTVTSTEIAAGFPNISAAAARTGIGMMVWPIPDTDLNIDFTSRVQHADLALAADVWTGVPNDVCRLIAESALQKGYESAIWNDAKMGRVIGRNVEVRRQRAKTRHDAQPNIRRVPSTTPGGHGGRNSRWRWDSQSIANPY